MKRNLYAVLLLALLAAFLADAGLYLRGTVRNLDSRLALAYRQAEAGHYEQAQADYRQIAQDAQLKSGCLSLFIRRSLLDQLAQTLATLPSYADAEHLADLSVETARARAQLQQLQTSFFGGF